MPSYGCSTQVIQLPSKTSCFIKRLGQLDSFPNFHAGDIVGSLLNRATKTISFTKNGLDLGVAFTNVNEDVLYPSVGLRTPDEEVPWTSVLLCNVSVMPRMCIYA